MKDKLTEALKERIEKIEERKLLEQVEKKKLEKMSKREREKYEKEQRFKNRYGSKKRKKSVKDEEREVHEAYQVILAEYHRRVMMRMKKKVKAVNMIRKLAEPMGRKDDVSGLNDQNVRIGWFDKEPKMI